MHLVAEPLAAVVSSRPAPVRLLEEVQGDDREELRQAVFEDPPPLGAIPGGTTGRASRPGSGDPVSLGR